MCIHVLYILAEKRMWMGKKIHKIPKSFEFADSEHIFRAGTTLYLRMRFLRHLARIV